MVFVAMPYGKRKDAGKGYEIDFDAIYQRGIQPAAIGLNLDLIRSDEERGGGIVHQRMFERLLVAEIAIVDVTVENANVYYELGVRHAAKPRSTIIIRAKGVQMPFDIRPVKTALYTLTEGTLDDEAAADLSATLKQQLIDAMKELVMEPDSPVYQLVPQYKGIVELDRAVRENVKERAQEVIGIRHALTEARGLPPDKHFARVNEVEISLGEITAANAESALDVLLAYRSLEAYEHMVAFIETFPPSMRESKVVREQHGLALNREAKEKGEAFRQRAIAVLTAIVDERGDNPETCGIIGRIYKDLYTKAKLTAHELRDAGKEQAIDPYEAAGHLDEAISWYRRGFVADPRDYYPGINLLTLMVERGGDENETEIRRVSAAVSFALDRFKPEESTDYWVIATFIESNVHENRWDRVTKAMGKIATVKPGSFELKTTLDNLKIIAGTNAPHIDAAQLSRLIGVFEARLAVLNPLP